LATLPEILIILATIAIVFGVGKLTQVGKNLGKVGKDLKTGFKEGYHGKEPINITPDGGTDLEHLQSANKTQVEEASIE